MRHRFHALCPYFAMFPESFVEQWVTELTRPNDVVFDPFCGRGTAPFTALLMERRAIGNDINPVAYCVSKAKTNAPAASQVRRRLTMLEQGYDRDEWEAERRSLPEFFGYAYGRETLRQLLYLRQRLHWRKSDTDCMIAAVTLGSLHGDGASASYLSNQMPRTISTKPGYSVRYWQEHGMRPPKRNAFDVLRRTVSFRYASEPPSDRALVLSEDVRDLPRYVHTFPRPVRFAITSPPYFDTTNYEEDQWLRLWFLGGAPHPTYGVISRDDRHEKTTRYWGLIGDMWRSLAVILDENANVVIRIGVRGMAPRRVAEAVEGTSALSRRPTKLVRWEASPAKGRQTKAFRPGSEGVAVEVDCHFIMV